MIDKNVNDQILITDDHIKQASDIYNDPQMIMRLIDLMFLYEDEDPKIVS